MTSDHHTLCHLEDQHTGLRDLAGVLGMRVTTAQQGEATVVLAVDDRLDNWLARAHGGAIMALANRALAAASAAMPGTPAIVQLHINLLAPPTKGEEVTATARVVHATRRVAVFGFEVRDARKRLLAQGQATGLAKPKG